MINLSHEIALRVLCELNFGTDLERSLSQLIADTDKSNYSHPWENEREEKEKEYAWLSFRDIES